MIGSQEVVTIEAPTLDLCARTGRVSTPLPSNDISQAAIEKLRTRLTFIRDIKTADGIQVLDSDHPFLL